jgi:prophage antirepressor-like protein
MYKSRFGMDFEIFKNQGLGNVRTAIDDNNQIWFVAKDITDILEIQNTADALKI